MLLRSSYGDAIYLSGYLLTAGDGLCVFCLAKLFISRCYWLIYFGIVFFFFFFCWTICFLPFFLLFIQSVYLWILIFHIKVRISWFIFWNSKITNFLKSTNSSITRLSFPLLLISSLILTSMIFGVPLISVFLPTNFQSVDFRNISAEFLFVYL